MENRRPSKNKCTNSARQSAKKVIGLLVAASIDISAHIDSPSRGGALLQPTLELSVVLEQAGARLVRNACAQQEPLLGRQVRTLIESSPLFVYPRAMPVALAYVKGATTLTVEEVDGDWLRIAFHDRRWGNRAGYIYCENVEVLSQTPQLKSKANTQTQLETRTPANPASQPTRSAASPIAAKASATTNTRRVTARVDGYLEWRRDQYAIVEGQRITWDDKTRIKVDKFASWESVPLGAEVMARGVRLENGSVLARDLLVKSNGTAMFEREAVEHFRALEAAVVREGFMLQQGPQNRLERIGAVATDGPDYSRARRILDKLRPPYVSATALRLYIVDNEIWNASAAANGAIFLYAGLLRDVNDDELAVVLGHELAHYTHEHIRRRMRQGMFRQLVAVGAEAAIQTVDDAQTQDAMFQMASIGLQAWGNGYSRANEDQADRVGLRYAFEAGFDVSQAIVMWQRARAREGELTRLGNFFVGSHSRPTERIRTVEQQLQLNYSSPRTADSNQE